MPWPERERADMNVRVSLGKWGSLEEKIENSSSNAITSQKKGKTLKFKTK